MRTEKAKVKSKQVVIGEASFGVFDTLNEAVDGLGEARVLALVNKQNKTDAMNAVRAGATGKPSKKLLRKQALSRITIDEFKGVAGDEDALEALISRKVAELEAEAPLASEVSEDEDEDDENA